ncbi:MAG: MopE-related protein, partial [bacterium]
MLAACVEGFVDADGRAGNGCEATCAAGAAAERCNGLDDDCDGRADEAFDTATSLDHCGACGRRCALPNADTRCVGGACTLARCQPGFSNDDGRLENGCESPCAPVSPGPEICDREDNDCDGDVDEGFDFLHDGEHCGRCGVRCAYAHGAGSCVDGLCRLTACEAGFVDADGRGENGCEARCTPSADGVDRCDETDEDCDGRVDEGFDKDADPENCGGCGRLDEGFICRFAHAEGACEAGLCVIGRCEAGFVDADGRVANGCETRCEPAADATERCNGLDDDCDGTSDEALQRPCGSDVGICQPGVERCIAGGWGACEGSVPPLFEVCNGRDDDCDGQVDVDADGEAAACFLDRAQADCVAGACQLVACEAGWFDVNRDSQDGCERGCGLFQAVQALDPVVLDSPMRVRTAPGAEGAVFLRGADAASARLALVVGAAAREVGDPLLTYVDGDLGFADPGWLVAGLADGPMGRVVTWSRRDAAGGLIAADSVPLANGRHVAVGSQRVSRRFLVAMTTAELRAQGSLQIVIGSLDAGMRPIGPIA